MAVKKRSKSVLKNIRKSARRYRANQIKKRRLKSAIKKIKRAATQAEALKLYPPLVSLLDKSVQDGIIKKNTAGRQKARILKTITSRAKK